jgi:hypothetical protein
MRAMKIKEKHKAEVAGFQFNLDLHCFTCELSLKRKERKSSLFYAM